MSLQVKYTVTSHQGLVRDSNEDIIEAFVLTKMDTTGVALRIQGMLLCDGMGGMKAGEAASRLASISVIDYIKAMPFWPSLEYDINQQLSDAIVAAHQNITMLSKYDFEKNGMATTIVLLLIVKNQAHILWSGDSRAYLLTTRNISQGINTAGIQLLTRDHSVSWDLVAKGVLTVDQARNHPQSHALTQSLGGVHPPKPDYESLPVDDGDRFMLCTDGVYLHLDSAEIKMCLHNHNDLELAAQAMTNLILERGAKDNFSIGILDIVKVQFAEPVLKAAPMINHQNQSNNRSNWFKWWFFLPIFFVLGSIVYGILKIINEKNENIEISSSSSSSIIASNQNYNQKLMDAKKKLEQESQRLKVIANQIVMPNQGDTSSSVGDESVDVAPLSYAAEAQKSIKKAPKVIYNKQTKTSTKKHISKEEVELYDDLYNEVLTHMNEYRNLYPNLDIYQQAYLIRLEQLLIEIQGKKKSNEYSSSLKINWQLEFLRNKFYKIQSEYKPK